MRYCKYCGAELEESNDVCLSCGRLLEKEVTVEYHKVVEGPLKGSQLMLVTMILQIIFNIIILIALPELGLLFSLDTLLVYLACYGFYKGKKGWATFAIVYGAISAIFSFASGNFLNLGILIFIAGIIAITKDNQ